MYFACIYIIPYTVYSYNHVFICFYSCFGELGQNLGQYDYFGNVISNYLYYSKL